MHFAKSIAGTSGLSLAASGAPARNLSDVFGALDPRGLEREEYPAPELKRAIASRYGVSAEQVVLTPGTSQANALVALAFVRPGDEVVVERPTYEALPGLAAWLGATLSRVERRREDGYALDLCALEQAITPRTRLVLLTHPHNPSGRAFTEVELTTLDAIACRTGVPVVVDEVYRDDLLQPPPVAARGAKNVITTSSLTKVYGLGSLRAGWAIAPKDVAGKLSDLNDFLHVVMPTPSLMLSHGAFPRLDEWRRETREVIAECRAVLEAFRARTGLLSGRIEDGVPFYLADLPEEDDRAFAARLRGKGVVVPPGCYYEAPGRARIGYGRISPEGLSRALAILETAGRA
jgi:aspartate/methionine/tyrosine aminotransferase